MSPFKFVAIGKEAGHNAGCDPPKVDDNPEEWINLFCVAATSETKSGEKENALLAHVPIVFEGDVKGLNASSVKKLLREVGLPL